MRVKTISGVVAGLAATLLLALPVAAQQRGTVTGTVLDATNRQPLAGAQVVVAGSTTGTITNPQGEYRLGGVRAGAVTVRAIMLGYDTQDRTVTVPAAGTVSADFSLPLSAVALNQIVVTVTGEQRKASLPNAISTVDAAAITQTQPISDVAQLLNGRSAGVNVLESSGTVGTGAKIRIRGANSVSLSNEPIIYVDGARLDNDPNSLSIGTGGQTISRLEDLNPADIESIEVVKGPSAATLYGTDAANGVIRITTKRGRSGRPSWNFFAETGTLSNSVDFPLNFRGKQGAGTVHDKSCFAFQAGAGSCTQTALLSYQPLNDPVVSPIHTGTSRSIGGSVAGGSDNVNYYLSGDLQSQIGDLQLPDSIARATTAAGAPPTDWETHPNADRRISVRANITAHVTESLNLTASTGYTTNRIHLPQNDNNAFGIVPSGVLGSYSPLLGQHGYGFLNPLETFSIETLQEINRSISSLQANWQPQGLPWLSGRATLGLDLDDRHDSGFIPVGSVTEFDPVTASGTRTSNRLLDQVWTADASATATASPRTWLSSRLTVGTQYIHNLLRGTLANGDGLTPGTKSLAASAEQFASEATTESKTLGFFGEEQVGFYDRLYITAGLRDDDNSAFGQDFKASFYPKIGASYVLLDDSRTPFFFVNSLRLRTAWGASGVAPGPRDALLFFAPSVTAIQDPTGSVATQPGITFGAFGNPNLKPERSQELEAGFDAGLFAGRAGLEFTYYHKKTSDALISRTLPPSLGGALARFENIGSVLNQGVELGLNATPVNLRSVKWELNGTGSYNQNKLLRLGTDVSGQPLPPIISGIQRFTPGFPLGGYWDNPITFSDANHDGIIEANEITRGDTAVFLGSDLPTNEVSISNALTFFNRLRVSALMDHRGGFKNYNFTEEFRCRFAICRGLNDPHASLLQQARAVNTVTLGGNRSAAPYVEDASFWKLRELSFTLFVPRTLSDRLGSHNLELVVTGRNLHTWTKYTGFDPEINENGQANFQQDEFLTQPPLRTWLVRLNASF